MIETLTPQALIDRIRYDRSALSAVNGVSGVVVDCTAPGVAKTFHDVSREELVDVPVVLVGVGSKRERDTPDITQVFDLVVEEGPLLEAVVSMIAKRPLAGVTTAILLRRVDLRSVPDSLVAESTTYSLLQSGPEFEQWQASRAIRTSARNSESTQDIVIVNRVDSEVTITLNQPQRRNAYSSRMRLALGDALEVAVFDPSIERVTLRGAGQNFSSGGDLDEFGQFSDPVTAHLLRLSTRVTHLLWNLRQRLGLNLRCEMQGENYGAGVELAAFAGRVSAVAGTTFTLPEVHMGLIPGSGGTASLPLRIGRHRTLLMALTGLPIDTQTALDWGLVDDIID
jgi:enoyl-CoA hydratase/carnithine racemase